MAVGGNSRKGAAALPGDGRDKYGVLHQLDAFGHPHRICRIRAGRLPDQAGRQRRAAELRAAHRVGPVQHRHLRGAERCPHLAGVEFLRGLRLLPGRWAVPGAGVPAVLPGASGVLRPPLCRRGRVRELPDPGISAGPVRRAAWPGRDLRDGSGGRPASALPAASSRPAHPRPRRMLVTVRADRRRGRPRRRHEHRLLRGQPDPAACPAAALATRARPEGCDARDRPGSNAGNRTENTTGDRAGNRPGGKTAAGTCASAIVRRITGNILRAFGTGPAGRQHPSVPNWRRVTGQ
jgi:hypothetical protein